MHVFGGFNQQPLLLKNLNLDRLFDVVLPSRYAGVAKPDPDIFYQALRKANVEGSEAVHVGDDYKRDYRGALVHTPCLPAAMSRSTSLGIYDSCLIAWLVFADLRIRMRG
jgi:hypothetical protein